MKIAVLVKQVPDTWEDRTLNITSGLLDRASSELVVDEICERALEVALAHKDANKSTEITVITMGPESAAKALRKALSMGADSAIHICDDALSGSDLWKTSATIATAIKAMEFDLVIAGNESTDGRGGVIPAMIAEHLNRPHLSFLNSVDITPNEVAGERGTEDSTMTAHAAFPAIISVTERTPEARFPNFKGVLAAKKKPFTVLSIADLGTDLLTPDAGHSIVLSTEKRPARVAGNKVIDEGNAGVELADFLAANRLL
jgi:electron transfer flavoprotein beta subunit